MACDCKDRVKPFRCGEFSDEVQSYCGERESVQLWGNCYEHRPLGKHFKRHVTVGITPAIS